MNDLGSKIREYRKSKGMTQETLAQLIGVKRAVISKYETNFISPSIDMLNKIASALDIPISSLLDNVNALQYDKELNKSVQNALDLMAKQQPKRQLLKAFDQLNSEGQNKVIEYANDITPKYKK